MVATAGLGAPLTHRGSLSPRPFITSGAKGRLPGQDWRALARAGGVRAAYMGVRTLPLLVERLAGAGLPLPPVTAVENATLQGQRVIPGILGDIAAGVAEAAPEGPTLVLIGEAVALVQFMPWEEPLRDAA